MWSKNMEKSIRLSSSSSVFTSTKIDGKKRKTIDTTDTFDTSKKRKIAQGCNVCGDSFSKGTV